MDMNAIRRVCRAGISVGKKKGSHKDSSPPTPEHEDQTYQRYRSIAALKMEKLVFSFSIKRQDMQMEGRV